MNISVLIPHYKTWKMSFFAIHQLLKFRGRHQLDIWVVDNNPFDGTAKNLEYYGDKIKIVPYPSDRMQSHGIAYDYVVPRLRTEIFATLESDSFPTSTDWLDWIELLEKDGYDSGGSCLDLSGGQFVHTAGAFYKKSIWQKAKRYVDSIEYIYLPDCAMKEGHACHLMVHKSVFDQFVMNPKALIELSDIYFSESEEETLTILKTEQLRYLPVARGVFHQSMGNTDESFFTYGSRDVMTERDNIIMDNKKPFLRRLGMEPGQWMCYWMLTNGYKPYAIPTETVWLPGRENQQQAYTKMENGFTHLWAVTAYNGAANPELKDIIDYKQKQMDELYASIPPKERI
jgi:hypothetical protein